MSVHRSAISDRFARRPVAVAGAVALAVAGIATTSLAHPSPASASPGCGGVQSWDFDQDGSRDLAAGAPRFDDPKVQLRLTNAGDHRHVVLPAPKGAVEFGSAIASVSSNEADTDTSFCAQLAVGAPGEEVDGKPDAGAVYLYKWDGSKLALRAKYTQGSNGVPGTPQQGARFGASLASAPLSDGPVNSAIPLYVGAPGQNVASVKGAGSITVLTIHDSPDGRSDGFNVDLSQAGMPAKPSKNAALGHSLAATGGVISAGAPGHHLSPSSVRGEGGVLTFLPGDGKAKSPQLVTQATSGVAGNPEPGDKFGYSVSAVSLNGPGSPVETLVGVPGEDDNSKPYVLKNSGVALSFRTDPTTGTPSQFHGYQQGSGGVGGVTESGDQFGYSVSVERGANGDLLRLVGAPYEDIGSVQGAGAVNEVGAAKNRLWFQGQKSPSVPGVPEAGDRFGFSVSGDSDLITGAIGEDRYGLVFSPWGYVGPLDKVEDGQFGTVVH